MRMCCGSKEGHLKPFHSIIAILREVDAIIAARSFVRTAWNLEARRAGFLRELVRRQRGVRLSENQCIASTTAQRSTMPNLFSSGKARRPQTEKGPCFLKSL